MINKMLIVLIIVCSLHTNCEFPKNKKADLGFLSFIARLSANRNSGNSNATTPPTLFSVIPSTTAILTTSEAGATSNFTLKLSGEPKASVTFNLSSSNALEGVVSPNSVTFTTTDWNNPKSFTVTGIDDLIADGNSNYQIITSNTVSSDPNFNALIVPDINVTNLDVGEKRVFVTSTTYDGALGGISGADNKCNSDASKPNIFPNIYKAFLVNAAIRVAASMATSNGTAPGTQIDWVMKPNTAYVRSDGVKIIDSNINGLFNLTLLNLTPIGGVESGKFYWTGLLGDWTTGMNCGQWNSSAGSGEYGNGSDFFNNAFAAGTYVCSDSLTRRLLCIQQ